MRNNVQHLINFFLVGIAIGLGVTAVDWVLPNQPHKIDVEVKGNACPPGLPSRLREPVEKSLSL